MTSTSPIAITRFTSEWSFLSNFYPAPQEFHTSQPESPVFAATAEHAYQASKVDYDADDADEWVARIIMAPTPGIAKHLGRQAPLRSDWDEVKDDVMYSVVRAKFEKPYLAGLLLATGDAYLEEGNTWGDVYWGTVNGYGRNQLGQTLMRVRSDIQAYENER